MSKPDATPVASTTTEPRRGFMTELTAIVIGGAVGLMPAIGGLIFLLNPLIRKPRTNAGEEATAGSEFRFVTRISSVPTDGAPQMFKVVGTKVDAWTTYPETELGAVYLRIQNGSVECFNARCPHLGCTVAYQPTQELYVCPCHDSSFTMSGERQNAIPPRSLDPLDVEIRNEVEVWVKFQNFRAGKAERVCV